MSIANPTARERAIHHLELALATGIRGAARQAVQNAVDVVRDNGRRELSVLQYESLKAGQELLDRSRPGFLARATHRGVKLMYRHSDNGRQIETLIGWLGEDSTSLATAREHWTVLRRRRLNGDALTNTPARPDTLTMAALCDRFMRRYSEPMKRQASSREDARLLNKHVVPTFGDKPAQDFSTEDVVTLLAGLSDRPREATKLRATIAVMFEVAAGRNSALILAESWLPRDHANPARNAPKPRHQSTNYKPALTEMCRYARGLQTAGVQYSDVLALQLLTTARIAEVAGLRWDEVDLDNGVWLLPAGRSKNGSEHRVFLSAPALDILTRRRQEVPADNPFVFPGERDAGRPASNSVVLRALAGHRTELGVSSRFTSHAIRHGFASWCGETKKHLPTVDRCLNHTPTGIIATYNGALLDGPARTLWAEWADVLLADGGVE